MGRTIFHKAKDIIKMLKRRPEICLLLGVVVFAMLRLWVGVKGSDHTRPANPPKPIFNSTDFVIDIYSGSLDYRDNFLQQSEVSFVLYYAPWCHTSLQAANQFAQTANEMNNDILFLAVNCWWIKGECRQSVKALKFPQIHLYHQNKESSIQYRGPHLVKYYREFLQKALMPLMYIGTSKAATSFLNDNQISIIIYCDLRQSPAVYKAYIEVALSALEEYPQKLIQFGVVLSRTLASKLELKRNVLTLYDRTFGISQPSSEFVMAENTSSEMVLKWATNRKMVLQRIFSNQQKSNALHTILKEGPTLITFITESKQLQPIDNISVRYHKQELKCHCCKSYWSSNILSVCSRNSRSIDSSQSCSMFNAMLDQYFESSLLALPPLVGNCCTTTSFYDPDLSRLEMCVINPSSNQSLNNDHVTIDGLAMKTNMTLRFLAMDYELTPDFAQVLGFSRAYQELPFVVIVDVQNEQKYIMKSRSSDSDIEKFILDYTNHLLTPSFVESAHQSRNEDSCDVCLPDILPQHFESTILTSNKDVLVYYHASWCGGCMECSHSLLNFKAQLGNFDNLIIYQVNDRVNEFLPQAFKAISFPTIILFLGNRKSESFVFSSSCSLVNIIKFILGYASLTTRAELLLELCNRDQKNQALIVPLNMCKQHEVLTRFV